MNKIVKHLKILLRRLKQYKELERIKNYENIYLIKIINAFLKVKKSKFNNKELNAFNRCEKYREQLLTEDTVISYKIFNSEKTALVKDICKAATSKEKWYKFIYAITNSLDLHNILEIGTNLGISGSYILEAIKDRSGSKFVTMEGLSQLCDISSKQFSSIVETSKYEIRQGLYDLTFPELISEKIKFDLMFIDGNHKKEPTIEYFNKLKCKISDAAIFIFDDINWSSGMKEAWEIIKNDKDVNFSLDFYKLGIVIIDKNEKLKGINFELFLTY